MTNAAKPGGSPASTWWWLLLLPIALVAGVGIANFPDSKAGPKREPTPAEALGLDGPNATGPVHWTSYASAVSESQRTGKPVMLDFNAEWCGPCQMLKRTVFDVPEMARKVEAQVIPVSVVDRYREDGRNPPETDELQRRYRIEGFPTLVVFSPRTGRSQQISGYGGPEATQAWITQAANSVR